MSTTVQAMARCDTCGKSWMTADALEEATQHAVAEHHHVKGLRQTRLDLDMREAS